MTNGYNERKLDLGFRIALVTGPEYAGLDELRIYYTDGTFGFMVRLTPCRQSMASLAPCARIGAPSGHPNRDSAMSADYAPCARCKSRPATRGELCRNCADVYCESCGHPWHRHVGTSGCTLRVDSAWTVTNDRSCGCLAKKVPA